MRDFEARGFLLEEMLEGLGLLLVVCDVVG